MSSSFNSGENSQEKIKIKESFSPSINNKIRSGKESNNKIKELYANFQKCRVNQKKNVETIQKKPQKTKNNNKSEEKEIKEINKEIMDILEIFKSASKILKTTENLETKIKNSTKKNDVKKSFYFCNFFQIRSKKKIRKNNGKVSNR